MKCKCKLKHLTMDCILQPRQLEISTTNMLFWAQDKIPNFPLIGDTAAIIAFHRGSTLLEFRVPRKPAPAKKCHLLSLRLTCAYRNDLQHMKESTRLHAPASKTPSSPIFCLLGTTYICMSNIVAMARYCSLKSSTATVQMIFQKLGLFLFLLVST